MLRTELLNTTEIKPTVGIDVSKAKLDVYDERSGHRTLANNEAGFMELLDTLEPQAHCIIEVTGVYHYQLALFLHSRNVKLSVVNPLVVKRFIQMNLKHVKTDRHDSRMLAKFGFLVKPPLWEPNCEYVEQGRMLLQTVEIYKKQRTALKNRWHSLSKRDKVPTALQQSLDLSIHQLDEQIQELEHELEYLMLSNEPELLQRIRSIPGIGEKAALLFLLYTNGFQSFITARQLASFVGVTPIERSSGSSVRGKSSIKKTNRSLLRNCLFLCSFTASKTNAQCKELYQRIIEKGKSKKLALIAVCNKLCRQVFGVVQSGKSYNPNV